MSRRVILVTDLSHEDRDEDLLLASRLGGECELTLTGPETAADLALSRGYPALLIRNAWPSRRHEEALESIERLAIAGAVTTYNPPSTSRGFRENKSYLADLYGRGLSVVPTWLTIQAAVAAIGRDARAVFKPIDGCSSEGVRVGKLISLPTEGGIFQPYVEHVHEVSLFYIDGVFSHAIQSAGEGVGHRWDLSSFLPSERDLAFGRAVVAGNGLAYGIQRIDALRTARGGLLLNEIEDFMPFLSLEVLSNGRRDRVLDTLVRSILARFCPSAAYAPISRPLLSIYAKS